MAIDGSTLEVPYSAANTGAFGSPPTGHGRGGYPQVRLVTMSGTLPLIRPTAALLKLIDHVNADAPLQLAYLCHRALGA